MWINVAPDGAISVAKGMFQANLISVLDAYEWRLGAKLPDQEKAG